MVIQYNVACESLMKPPNPKTVSGNVLYCCWNILYINIDVHYKLINDCNVLFLHLHLWLVLPNHMAYDGLYCTWNFLTSDILLFIQLICGCILIIVFNINFGIICLNATSN